MRIPHPKQNRHPTVGTGVQRMKLQNPQSKGLSWICFLLKLRHPLLLLMTKMVLTKQRRRLPQHFQANHHLHSMEAWKTLDINFYMYKFENINNFDSLTSIFISQYLKYTLIRNLLTCCIQCCLCN